MNKQVSSNGIEKGSQRSHSEIIAVTSGKGGVGKTSFSANLSIALRQMNRRVLLIDADLHLGNVDIILGARPQKTIADVLQKDAAIEDVIVDGPGQIDILPASSASIELIKLEDVALKKLAEAFSRLRRRYDYIFLDTGAGIARNVITFLLASDKIILLITPDPASIADAYAVIKIVRSVNREVPILLTANMVNTSEEGDILYKKMNLMVQKFLNSKIIFGGSVKKDDIVAASVKHQKPFIIDYPNSVPANAFRLINRRMLQTIASNGKESHNVFERLIENRKIEFEWNL